MEKQIFAVVEQRVSVIPLGLTACFMTASSHASNQGYGYANIIEAGYAALKPSPALHLTK